nr:immunoglobulin heavy chain junction region [Mus musculus]
CARYSGWAMDYW